MILAIKRFAVAGSLLASTAWPSAGLWAAENHVDVGAYAPRPVQVGEFDAEIGHAYTSDDGLPSNDVLCMAVHSDGVVIAGTSRGLALRDSAQEKWATVQGLAEAVHAIDVDEGFALAIVGRELHAVLLDEQTTIVLATLPSDWTAPATSLARNDDGVFVGGREGLLLLEGNSFLPVDGPEDAAGRKLNVRQLAASDEGELAIAAASGLYLRNAEGAWQTPSPRDGKRSWQLYDVHGVAYDRQGRLWFASPQGVGCRDGDRWRLFTGAEGVPCDDFTTVAAGERGVVWFGTKVGAIRFDGKEWYYRQGRRWVPDDDVRAIAVGARGHAWFATPRGVGLIERRAMTLAAKAQYFEEEIDRYHRRTPYGYVDRVTTSSPGKKEGVRQHDSDNDGLWTSMYGAGECFAYGATKEPAAKRRATAAFEAVKFLSDVTQGSMPAAKKGFPARSILPTSGPDPNERDNAARDRAMREEEDPYWKILSPRWPVSADGKWYWKADTSSDELDGHYFLYAAYHDLVAETPEEKARVRQVVNDVTSHLIENDYALVDHDGQPTRWARFGRDVLDHGHLIDGRGLNSLSILSYLKVAEHVTGDEKFSRHYDRLVNEHSYAANTFYPKWSLGPGTGNQSDDEMALMCYYTLLRYETDPRLLRLYRQSLAWYWALERDERNPLFNFIFAASWDGEEGFPVNSVPQEALDDAVDTLKRLPLDRFDWAHRNSHRIDVVPLRNPWFRNTGFRIDGKVLPVDERFFEHWNHNPWRLDIGGNGQGLGDGAVYLLPYYLGLYHGFIIEQPPR